MNHDLTPKEEFERGVFAIELTEAEALRECARALIVPFWPVAAPNWRLA